MLKIRDNIIQKFYKSDLTTTEQLIYKALISICDENGIVKENYYKEIIEMVNCSIAQYYRVIKNLEEKRFIDKLKNKKDILIIGNDLSENIRFGKYTDFCDLNLEIFESEKYKKLKAGSRRLLEYFLFRILKCKDKTKIKEQLKNYNSLKYKYKKNSIHTFNLIKKEVFNGKLTLRMFKTYLKELVDNKFISIGYGIDINKKKYDIVTILASELKVPTIEIMASGKKSTKQRNSKHKHFVHILKFYLKRYKISSDNFNINNVADLFIQYGKKAKEQRKNIYQVIKTAISNYSCNNSAETLDSRIIHSLVKRILIKDYDNGILIY